MTDSLDTPQPSTITLIAPGGTSFTISKDLFQYSPALGILELYDDLGSQVSLEKYLNITSGNPSLSLEDGKLPHTLYGVPDRQYKLIFDFLTQLHEDKGKMPPIPEMVSVFDPEAIMEDRYWQLVKDISISDCLEMGYTISVFFGLDSLQDLVLARFAFYCEEARRVSDDNLLELFHQHEDLITKIAKREIKNSKN